MRSSRQPACDARAALPSSSSRSAALSTLPFSVTGSSGQHDVAARTHVVRQARADPRADRADHVAVRVLRVGHDERDDFLRIRRVLDGNHRALADAGLRRQHRCDLAEFDTVAADLQLIVHAPEILDRAVGQPASEIARAVQALRAIVRQRDELVVRERRVVQIAARDAGARDAELADLAVGQRRELRVEHMDRRAGHRMTDRRRAAERRARHAMHRREDRRLGRAVEIDQRVGRAVGVDRLQLFAGREQVAQRQIAAARCAHEVGHHHGRDERVRRRMVAMKRDECIGVGADLFVGQQQRRAGRQRRPDLPLRDVETQSGHQRHPARGRYAELAVVPVDQPRDRMMLDLDALRPAGRARREDHVEQIVRRRCAQLAVGRIVADQRRHRERRDARARRFGGRIGARVERDGRTALFVDVAFALRRIRIVDRNVGGAGLQHAEQRHEEIGGAHGFDRNQAARRDAACDQRPRDAIAARVQFAVGQRRIARENRGVIRRFCDACGKGVQNGRFDGFNSHENSPLILQWASFKYG